MDIRLLKYTSDAKELLIFSKRTRLGMSLEALDEVFGMSDKEKEAELKYVFGTVGSSWEFVDYVFLIKGVTRAFTHQLVRHRVGVSFAQQAQRVVDMSDFEYLSTGNAKGNSDYSDAMAYISDKYESMIKSGINPQDARGVLPTNILTNILFKVNLRALSDIVQKRLCYRAQGEFQDVAKEFVRLVLRIHPWASPVLEVGCVKNLSCPWENFEDCPVKKKFGFLKKDDRVQKRIRNFIDEKGRIEFQPKGG